ncbi:transcriptional regulator, GntR family [Albimonas donghaensis]|uniref:Transcriptional regulator, GntR family n=1 Tax=Albimonas donghaensis TaxID=356660 RepID=A0A1H3DQM6_9RHOB|nr:GntR family transcriptional regulator [Albimonas donghaensis]SDX68813.1 transcriptional regulator, GntR family [Albimonas donghaensis]
MTGRRDRRRDGEQGIEPVALDRERGAPLHHQLYLVLSDAIASGRYEEGDALPTEERLTEIYGVSRITVRRAMSSLHENGLIDRGSGKRTRVRGLGDPVRGAGGSIVSNIIAMGAETVARVLEFEYVEARGFARQRLWMGDQAPVQRAVRLRSIDGAPMGLLTSYVPEVLGRTWTEEELGAQPLHALLARAGADVTATRQLASAALAEPLVASRLGVHVGAALIDLRCLMIARDGRVVEYVEILAPPDRMRMRYDFGLETLEGPVIPAKAGPKQEE